MIARQMQAKFPVIQNVVSFAQLSNQNLNLKAIAEKVSGSRYNKKRFPAVIVRKTKPKSTLLIFRTGKVIIIGSENQEEAEIVAKKSAREIEKILNVPTVLKAFRITNIVANADLGYEINIGKLAEDQVAQKDDSFPGAIHQMKKPVKAVLLFSSGKVIFTGANSFGLIEEAYLKIHNLMVGYQRGKKIEF